MKIRFVVLLLLALAFVVTSQAQAVYVYGRVVDEQGRPKADVTVTFVKFGCESCRLTAVTNEWGVYNYPDFPWCGSVWLGGCNAPPILTYVNCDQGYEWIDQQLVCRRFPPPPGPDPNDPGGENP